MTADRGLRRRWGAGVAALLVAASLLTACSASRTGQGTTAESCYLALPTASEAVGDHGHLEGVRKFTLSGLHGVAPRLYKRLADEVPKGQAVCVVGYTGKFTATMVSKPLGRPTGTLAVVVVTTPANHLLGTLILTKIPVRFQHLF
ncbi:MAG TPA: hypothetical protein VN820_07390 [Acidimicrobiales bacterium]|nr:hypothetical protein [Acidimicrobiales bacterium]